MFSEVKTVLMIYPYEASHHKGFAVSIFISITVRFRRITVKYFSVCFVSTFVGQVTLLAHFG